MHRTKNSEGFTLLEMLLSIAILAVVAGASLPVLMSFKDRQDLAVGTQSLVDALRRAQQYSASGRRDDVWGVNFQPSMVTVFKGSSYAARDASYDETDTISSTISLSYVGDVVYAGLTGIPSISGQQILTSQISGDVKTITLNAKGMVEY